MILRRALLRCSTGVLLAALAIAQPAVDRRFVIVLIGPTGSGKTTQAQFLKRKYGASIIAVDELVQHNPAALAKYREPGIVSGSPQTSEALDSLVAERLNRLTLTRGVVLDGYPATKDQADHLTALVRRLKLPTAVIIQLDVPDDTVRARLAKRKRADDTPAQIEQRLKDYHRELDMVRAYYPQANIWTVDGTKTPAEVSKTIQAIVSDELPKRTPR